MAVLRLMLGVEVCTFFGTCSRKWLHLKSMLVLLKGRSSKQFEIWSVEMRRNAMEERFFHLENADKWFKVCVKALQGLRAIGHNNVNINTHVKKGQISQHQHF